jgi:hypothetical protein
MPVFEREAPLYIGAGLRLTRMDAEPFTVEDAVEAHANTAVRWLADAEGICSALLVDRNTGHSIGEKIWLSPQALAAGCSVAARSGLTPSRLHWLRDPRG